MEQQYEEEIDLIEYARIIFKRKWIILGIFLAAAISSGVWSSFMPKIYKIDTTLEIGKIKDKTIENPTQVIKKIDADVYGILARKNLQIPEENYPKITAVNPKGTSLINIKIESSNINISKKILEEINKIIVEKHNQKIEDEKEMIKNNIKIIEDKMVILENDIKRTKNKILPLKEDIKRIKNKIKHGEEEKKNLEAKIDALQKILPYQQDPGTQFALFDTKEKLANKKQEIENLYSGINSLKLKIENINLTINSLRKTKNNYKSEINNLKLSLIKIKPTKIIKPPIVSKIPVKPNKKLNIIIAGILGLLMGLFVAFATEWWQKAKK